MLNLIRYHDGKEKAVKSLDWLLRNRKKIIRFHVFRAGLNGCLVAFFKDADMPEDRANRFETDYWSWTSLLDYLARPAFLGLPVRIYYPGIKTPSGQTAHMDTDIGSMAFEVQRQNPWLILPDQE